jgi:hypothetical protein
MFTVQCDRILNHLNSFYPLTLYFRKVSFNIVLRSSLRNCLFTFVYVNFIPPHACIKCCNHTLE